MLEAVPIAGVDDTSRWLREECGIELAATGDIATGQEPRFNPHQPFQPVLGLQGLLSRAIAEKQRAALLDMHADAERIQRRLARAARRRDPAGALVARQRAAAHLRHQVRLRAAAGKGAGGWVEACPRTPALCLTDSEFEFGVRWRLGLATMQSGPCRHRPARLDTLQDCDAAEGRCGRELDTHGDHAVLCGRGRGRYRSHTAVCKCLGRFAREANVEYSFEEVCPALLRGAAGSDEAVEARLDLHLWSSSQQWLWEAWLDATVTHPWREALRHKAAREDGAAAAEATRRKRRRYGDGSGGIAVTAVAVETWGRLGDEAAELLAQLAAHWAGGARAGPAAAAATERRWRAELGIALTRAQAATAAQASAPLCCAGRGEESDEHD